jgi:hypothetical protein
MEAMNVSSFNMGNIIYVKFYSDKGNNKITELRATACHNKIH